MCVYVCVCVAVFRIGGGTESVTLQCSSRMIFQQKPCLKASAGSGEPKDKIAVV